MLVPKKLRGMLDSTLRSLRNGNVDWVRNLAEPFDASINELAADAIVPPAPDISSLSALNGSKSMRAPRFGDIVEAYTRRDT